MKTKIFISLFILYFLGACNPPTMSSYKPKEPSYSYFTFRIKGTIADSTNNSPVIAIFSLCIGFYGFITDAHTNNEGHYTIEYTYAWDTTGFPFLAESNLWLRIEATGYKTKYIMNDDINHVRLTEEWQTIDVQLERESSNPFSR